MLNIKEDIYWPLNRLSRMVMARSLVRSKENDYIDISGDVSRNEDFVTKLEPSLDDILKILIKLNKLYIIFFFSFVIFIFYKIITGYHKYIH